MPLIKKKDKGRAMASISQDDRSLAEKAKAKALFETRKKKEEEQGADFETPQYLQNKSQERKQKLGRALAVGAAGAAIPMSGFATPIIPATMSAVAKLSEKVIPKEKQQGELYQAITAGKVKGRFKKKSK